MKKIIRFRFLIAGGMFGIALMFLVAYEQHRAAQEYQRHRTEYCAKFSATPEKQEACAEKGSSSRDYLPWAWTLFVWPEGITTWAIIGTGFVIAWQSNETRRAAIATERSVTVARRQLDMIKDERRAIIEIRATDTLKLKANQLGDSHIWGVKGIVAIRNLGITRAWVNKFQMQMYWYKKPTDQPNADSSDYLVVLKELFIDPTIGEQAPITQDVAIWDTAHIEQDWFAQEVYAGRVTICLRGFIEYRTVGTRYKQFFLFHWSPVMFQSGMYDKTAASTNYDKLRYGFWNPESIDENEIGPEERQKPN